MIVLSLGHLFLTLGEILAIVQIAVIAGNAVVATKIFGLAISSRVSRVSYNFSAMPGPDDLDLIIRLEQLL